MSDSVSVFQTQVASVLEVLLNVAVAEITKLFEGGSLVSQGDVISDSGPKATLLLQGELRAKAEYALRDLGKNIRSIGVQVREGDCAGEVFATETSAIPTEGGAVFRKGRGHTRSQTEDVGISSPKPAALKCECTDVEARVSSAAPPVVHGWKDGGDTRAELGSRVKDVIECGADAGERPAFKQQHSEEECDPQLTPAEGPEEQVTQDTPAEGPEEQVTQASPAEGPEEEHKDRRDQPKTNVTDELSTEMIRQGSPMEAREADRSSPQQPPQVGPHPGGGPPFGPPSVGTPGASHSALRPCSVRLVNVLLCSGAQGRSPALRRVPKDLRPHQRLHTGKRLCCFTQCGNGVWRLQSMLARGRPHGCRLCGKKFKRRKKLRRHERFHTGERPYSCSQCWKTFVLRKNLRRHERFHTGERPHCCSYCGKRFRLRESLKTHLRFHTGERPYSCTLCTKRFRIQRNLERHRVTHGSGTRSPN